MEPEKLIYYEGKLYTKRGLEILKAARQISKRITKRRVSNRKWGKLPGHYGG